MKKDQNKRAFDWTLRHDFHAFVERSFYELNPTTQFQDNWHIGVIADRMEQFKSRRSQSCGRERAAEIAKKPHCVGGLPSLLTWARPERADNLC
jgi:hypothetical protein